MDLNSIIQVSITRETKPISIKGFSTMLILGVDGTFEARSKSYTQDDLAALAADLSDGVDSLEYIHASAVFSQEQHISYVWVGRKDDGDDDYTEALNAILEDNKDFFGVTCTSRLVADQEEIAQWCQANGRVFVAASADADIIDKVLDDDSTSIAALVKAQALSNTMALYHSKAATEAADAAFLGYVLSLTPGSYTGAYKTLSAVTVDNLSTTASTNAHNKLCSTYEELASVNVVLFSWVGTGEYLDIIIFAYWLIARIQEANVLILINQLKSPITDDGVTAHENATRQVLEQGITNKGITPFKIDPTTKKQVGGYSTSFPAASDIPTADKLGRKLTGAKFRAYLAGAIHTVKIDGVLTV